MKTRETKMHFSQCFPLVWPKQGKPCERARPDVSENFVAFEFWRFWTRVIGCQSLVKIEEKNLWRGGVTKKRHGHNVEFWGPPSNQRGPNMVGSTLIQWQRSKLKIAAVGFFFTPPSPLIFSFKFDLTLTANNYGLKPSKLKNVNIFRNVRTCSFTWFTLFRSY